LTGKGAGFASRPTQPSVFTLVPASNPVKPPIVDAVAASCRIGDAHAWPPLETTSAFTLLQCKNIHLTFGAEKPKCRPAFTFWPPRERAP